jgi:hypothetical protein
MCIFEENLPDRPQRNLHRMRTGMERTPMILSHEKIRKPVAPPTKVMKDPKKEASKKACRTWKY